MHSSYSQMMHIFNKKLSSKATYHFRYCTLMDCQFVRTSTQYAGPRFHQFTQNTSFPRSLSTFPPTFSTSTFPTIPFYLYSTLPPNHPRKLPYISHSGPLMFLLPLYPATHTFIIISPYHTTIYPSHI